MCNSKLPTIRYEPYTYLLNEFLTAHRSCTTHLKKNSTEVFSPYLYASFGTFCRMLEHRQIIVFEGKCHRGGFFSDIIFYCAVKVDIYFRWFARRTMKRKDVSFPACFSKIRPLFQKLSRHFWLFPTFSGYFCNFPWHVPAFKPRIYEDDSHLLTFTIKFPSKKMNHSLQKNSLFFQSFEILLEE